MISNKNPKDKPSVTMEKLDKEKAEALKQLKKDANARCKTWIQDVQNQSVSRDFSKPSKDAQFVKTPIYLSNKS
jgi:hypothetical protein